MIGRAATFLASCVAGVALSLAVVAAQQPTDAQKSAIRSACPADFQAHCAGVSPGGAAALQCLEKNVAKLSSGCQAAVKAVMPASSSTAPAPTTSSDSSNDDSGGGSSGDTTTQPAAQPAAKSANTSASDPDDEAMPPVRLSVRQEIMLVRQSCGADFRNYCGNVPLGGGNAVACLHRHRAQLSPNCKEALAAALLR